MKIGGHKSAGTSFWGHDKHEVIRSGNVESVDRKDDSSRFQESDSGGILNIAEKR